MTTTKLELQQTNTRLATENAGLREANSQLLADLAIATKRQHQLEGDIERITSVASAMNTIDAHRPTQPQWQRDRAEAMAAAKSMAMAARIVVKV